MLISLVIVSLSMWCISNIDGQVMGALLATSKGTVCELIPANKIDFISVFQVTHVWVRVP